MADSFADAALGSFLPESKGRRKRAPIRPAEHAAQHVNHDGQGVALMSSALTIGTERQERPAREHAAGIGRATALAVNPPTGGDRVSTPPSHFDFAERSGARSHVDHDGRLLFAGERDGNRVGA